MLVENSMYFALGLLIAGVLALIVMPAVWRRAVRLTKRRIEAATPISMAEFRADKDHLRAEFALQTRRMEMSIENLRQRLSEQLGEVAQARTDAAQIRIERDQHNAVLLEAKKREEILRARISELEKDNAQLNQTLRQNARQEAGLPDIVEADDNLSRAEKRLNAILAKTASAAGNDSASSGLLADELSSLEASDAVRAQVQALEAGLLTRGPDQNLDEASLRKELTDIANGISRLVYTVEDKPAPNAIEESLFERIKRFADDGETEDILPAPAVTQRGSVTDRLSALRELRGS